jgi:hypothetical protein
MGTVDVARFVSEPVFWASDLTGEGPFGEIARSPLLARALDELCRASGWVPRGQLGMVPVRFPRLPPADDRGWHVDSNVFPPGGGALCGARSQTMLLLTLLSDVGPDDAPTRIRIGSQRDAASERRPLAYATGQPGDVYLVHPLTVHAADEHRGGEPRFMAQTPLFLTAPLTQGGSSALSLAIATEAG